MFSLMSSVGCYTFPTGERKTAREQNSFPLLLPYFHNAPEWKVCLRVGGLLVQSNGEVEEKTNALRDLFFGCWCSLDNFVLSYIERLRLVFACRT